MIDHRPEEALSTVERIAASGLEHPDPRTLCEPEHDRQGLLRWATVPLARSPFSAPTDD